MTYLLDVNVLIALIDPTHVFHDAAHDWFERVGEQSWATCPITENGVLRIVGHPKYPNSAGSPAAAARVFASLRSRRGHTFWEDTLSLLGSPRIEVGRVATAAQVTDTYLLALAVEHSGQLATFDHRLSPLAVIGGKQSLHIIDRP